MHAADEVGAGLRRARSRPPRPDPARHWRQPLDFIDQTHPGQYDKPLQVTRRYLDELDAVSPTVPTDRRVLAALGPKMLELARDHAGGAHPYLVTPDTPRSPARRSARARSSLPEQHVVLETDAARARHRP